MSGLESQIAEILGDAGTDERELGEDEEEDNQENEGS